eukprot:1159169-Pelagomonas_calceolata.AAC.7
MQSKEAMPARLLVSRNKTHMHMHTGGHASRVHLQQLSYQRLSLHIPAVSFVPISRTHTQVGMPFERTCSSCHQRLSLHIPAVSFVPVSHGPRGAGSNSNKGNAAVNSRMAMAAAKKGGLRGALAAFNGVLQGVNRICTQEDCRGRWRRSKACCRSANKIERSDGGGVGRALADITSADSRKSVLVCAVLRLDWGALKELFQDPARQGRLYRALATYHQWYATKASVHVCMLYALRLVKPKSKCEEPSDLSCSALKAPHQSCSAVEAPVVLRSTPAVYTRYYVCLERPIY